ncbi:DUF3450 domain-containing protein [Salinisphaera sp. PC39]|uniref:DUF3450 domain-containing protein n=1 Tax=Salinisphaera sp. PC39 TaxID=1304156 RepID=UPI00333F27F3
MLRTMRAGAASLCCLLILGAAGPASAADATGQALGTAEQTNRQDAASQNRIDELSEETREMLEAYRTAITRKQQLEVYNRELARIVEEQVRRKERLSSRVDEVARLGEEIEPLMLRMIDGLQRFVESDLPFRLEARKQRIQDLRGAVSDPGTNAAEQFRRVLEAYQKEAEYGRTMGTYRGELTFDGEPRLVEFLRVGRVMLFYISPDDANVGYWDSQAEAWKPLPARYRRPVREGIRVARDQAAPQLVEIAVPAPSPAEDGDGGEDGS